MSKKEAVKQFLEEMRACGMNVSFIGKTAKITNAEHKTPHNKPDVILARVVELTSRTQSFGEHLTTLCEEALSITESLNDLKKMLASHND